MKSPHRILLRLCLSEFIGTAALLSIGLSCVIFNWGSGSPVARLMPYAPYRRLLTGFMFGSTACLVSLSPVGKISGAHINPAVSLAFWMRKKMKTRAMLGYIISQMLGAVAGSIPLLLWGAQGKSVDYGNTVPGDAGVWAALLGEVVTTACLITTLFGFLGSPRLRGYTPFTLPFLLCFLVWAEGAISGTSINPARSFGPAVISNVYTGFWVFLAGPMGGAAGVVLLFRALRLHHYNRIKTARIAYHDQHSPDMIKSLG